MSELDTLVKNMYDNCTSSGTISTMVDSDTIGSKDFVWNWVDCYGNKVNALEWWNKPKGDDDMRYLYEGILVNPKNDDFFTDQVVARSETSALMAIYAESNFIQPPNTVPFDDLKTSCRVLMEWKKEKSLKKAIETIKEAVE